MQRFYGLVYWVATLCCTGLGKLAIAQSFSFSPRFEVPVLREGEPLANPWHGGFNSAQFWALDLNADGEDDLLLYDKAARKPLTFLAEAQGSGWRWTYRPEFEDALPPIESWISTADFNCDGKVDLFTGSPSGIRVYRNTSSGPGAVSFELETEGLSSQGFNGPVNVQVNPYGAPAFTDVDGDGDLDVLTFDFNGNTVEYHRNRKMETAGTCAGFDLKKDSCVFGRFATKPACGQIRLNTGCLGQMPPPDGGENPSSARISHIGSQLAAYDLDGDGDQDLLVGDLGCPLLNRLTNGGTAASALITQADTLFPSPNSYVKLPNFPSAYFVDLDFDGRRDLVATPTYFGNFSDDYANKTRSAAWYYRNQSSGVVPDFQFVEKDFLQNQGLDVGEESIPAFADADGDGDQDLFLGHTGEKVDGLLKATIWFFRNTGTSLQPRFEFQTSDYLGLSELGLNRIRPLIFDYNRDGALDFGWLATAGSFPFDSTRLRYLPNQAGPGQGFSHPPLAQSQRFPFAFNRYDSPVFYDIDADNLPDMLLGRYSGRIQYWRATQAWPNPAFALVSANYGNIARAPFATNPCLALADADQNGLPDLFVGDFTGSLKIYRDLPNQNASQFSPDSISYFSPLYGQNVYHAWGNYSSPALADLNGDGFPELAMGQTGGGLNLLVNRLGPNAVKERPVLQALQVYPNPTGADRVFRISGAVQGKEVEVWDSWGRTLGKIQETEGAFRFPLAWPSGWYGISLSTAQGPRRGRVWIH